MFGVRAFIGGVAGAMAMTIAALLIVHLGADVALEGLVGAAAGFSPSSPNARAVGFVLHLLLGGWLGLLYGYGFEYLGGRAGWSVGAFFAMAHAIVAGFAVGLAGAAMRLHVATDAPAMFMAQQGLAGVCWFILLHLLYGAVVGSLYAFTRTPAPSIRFNTVE